MSGTLGPDWPDGELGDFDTEVVPEAVDEGPDPEPTPADDWDCDLCDRTGFKTLQGLQVHQGRAHKESVRQEKVKKQAAQPPKAPKSTADIIDGAIRTSKAAGKLSVQSTTILTQLLGVALVLITIRAINAGRTPPLNEREQASLELDQAHLQIMFKPLFDALGSSKMVANQINNIAGHRDYLLCGVYWYQYMNTVRDLVQTDEIKADQPTQKTEAKKEKNNGTTEPADPVFDLASIPYPNEYDAFKA